MTTEVVPVRQPVVTFSGGPHRFEADSVGAPRYKVAYDVPKNTCDPRYSACTEHHVACDCREAELAEQLGEYRAEWGALRSAFRRALVGHQVHAPGWWRGPEEQFEGLCLCPGCLIVRTHGGVFRWGDVDWDTGRVKPTDAAPAPGPMGWAAGEVPF